MGSTSGKLMLVLHAHLPWVLGTEYEQWLHQAVLECYLPLCAVLERSSGRLSLSMTPVLAAMLEDPEARQRTRAYIEQRATMRADSEADQWHIDAAQEALRAFDSTPILRRLGALAGAGKVELLASAVTHGFLPLLATVSQAAEAQIALGVEAHRRVFDQQPAGFWLPECAYAPGLDAMLVRHGIRCTFLESHALHNAVRGTSAHVFLPSGLAVFGRDAHASEQVWSSEVGYPADISYAEFHRRENGQRVWAIADQGQRRTRWNPSVAKARATEHAQHFVEARRHGDGLQTAPFDAELFGHWWLEGPWFLEEVLRHTELLVTPREWLEQHPTAEVLEVPASSWGRGGGYEVWLGPHNSWVWPHLHRAAERLVATVPSKSRDAALVDLLLAQSSDWPFLIDARTCAGFAQSQFENHLLRFQNHLASELATPVPELSGSPFSWARADAYDSARTSSTGLNY